MVRLPAEYQEVEYLESTGTQWIDTGVEGNDNNVITCIFSVQDISNDTNVRNYIIGARKDDKSRTQFSYSYARFYGWGNFSQQNLVNVNRKIHEVVVNQGTFVLDGTTICASNNHIFDVEEVSIGLFAINLNDGTAASISSGVKIYKFAVSKNDTLLANFIPCYCKSDNEPGMYDTVSKTFYTNSGTGTFLIGNPVYYDTASLLERRRQILLNTPHIKTVSDSVASFNTDIATDLKGLKVYFSPVQEGTGDPSPDNVRPITGWDGIEVNIDRDVHRLIPIDWKTVTYNGITREYLGNGKYHCYGTLTKAYSTDRIYFEPFTCSTENGRKIRFNNSVAMNGYTFRIYFNNDASNVEWWVFDSINRSTNNPYTTMAGKYINNFQMEFLQVGNYYDFTFQIEFTVSEAPISISFPQTIYGGYADLVSGEVVEEYGVTCVKDLSWSLSNTVFYARNDGMVIGTSAEGKTQLLSERYNTVNAVHGVGSGNNWSDKTIRCSDGQISIRYIYIKDTTYATVNAFKEARGDDIIVYELATPNTYTLTPETIKALKGVNNIWSNANGNVEVSFYSH